MQERPTVSARFLRDDLAALQPYHVEPVPHQVKLDANESPFDLPESARNEIAELFAAMPPNRYPDADTVELRGALAERLRLDPGWVAVGNGSDELISYLIQALGRPDCRVLSPEPTFSMYRILSQGHGVEYVGVPLDDRFEIDADALLGALRSDSTNIVFLSYPNNPTGNCWDATIVESLLRREDVLVVSDEAYFEYSGLSFIALLRDHVNLIVLRTFSKAYGIAGLRVGYMAARPEWIGCVNKVRLPYNVNAFSQAAAGILLRHSAAVREQAKRIVAERDRVFAAMVSDSRFEPFRSDANFVLFRVSGGATECFYRLVRGGVLVRCLDRPGALSNCLRVTIGTPEENDRFLGALLARD